MTTRTERYERTDHVLDEVMSERKRQHAKWGEQNHPDGTGPGLWLNLDDAGYLRRHGIRACDLETWARARCQQADRDGGDTYERILTEEWAEAIACDDPAELRAELLQVAAVAVAWIEAIDRRVPRDRSGVASIARGVSE